MHSCLVRSSDGCAPSSSASERHVWHPGRLGGLAEGGPGGHDVLALRGQVDQPKCVCSGTRRAKLQRSSMWTMSHVLANVTSWICRERRSANITSSSAVSFERSSLGRRFCTVASRHHGRGSKNVRFMVDYVAQWRGSAKLSRMSVGWSGNVAGTAARIGAPWPSARAVGRLVTRDNTVECIVMFHRRGVGQKKHPRGPTDVASRSRGITFHHISRCAARTEHN